MKKVVAGLLAFAFVAGTVAISAAPAQAKGRECAGRAPGNPCK